MAAEIIRECCKLPAIALLQVRSKDMFSENPGLDNSSLAALGQAGVGIIHSTSEQECRDFTLLAHVLAARFGLPFFHLYDGSIKVSLIYSS